MLTIVALCGFAQGGFAQIYDEQGQYVDTIFHDVEVYENPLRMQLRYDIGCYTEQRMAEFAKRIKENIKILLRCKEVFLQ